MPTINKQRGFTSIELVVVIVIILGLALTGFLALNSQRSKARDSKRISDVRQIRTALEFYNSDAGEYPVLSETVQLGQTATFKLCSKAEGGFVSADKPCATETTYMSEIPTDPLPGSYYSYTGSISGYDLSFSTENVSSLGTAGSYHAHSDSIDKNQGNK